MATYSNNLRITEITPGDETDAWGGTTNNNLQFIADAFGYGTKQMAADADETFTMANGSSDTLRSMYLSITSAVSLTTTRTVTIAPNDVSKVWFIRNNTSGAQSIIIKQGSGSTVTVANGQMACVYTDGGGSGGSVVNILTSAIMVTPVLGTPTSVVLTNATGLPLTTGVTGVLALANGGTGVAQTAPGADRIQFWDHSARSMAWLTVGTGLTITGTTLSSSTAGLPRSARTSNTVLGAADIGYLIDFTANTWTQTFAACATLGANWWGILQNSGTGNITLDPDSGETIDGLTSFIMYPGEVRLVQCDGSVLRTIVYHPFSLTMTSSGTFTTPPGYKQFGGEIWGGGGGGAKGDSTAQANGFYSGGGGGGACLQFTIPAPSLGATVTYTQGAGGAGGNSDGTAGTAGGNSTFGSLFTAYGGGGGYFGVDTSFSGGAGGGGGWLSAGGTATGGSPADGGGPVVNSSSSFGGVGFGGGQGGSVTNRDASYGGAGGGSSNSSGGSSVYGGGGGGGTNPSALSGGTSIFGGAGGAGSTNSTGVDGVAPGGGGGASGGGSNAGSGGRGELRIRGLA